MQNYEKYAENDKRTVFIFNYSHNVTQNDSAYWIFMHIVCIGRG